MNKHFYSQKYSTPKAKWVNNRNTHFIHFMSITDFGRTKQQYCEQQNIREKQYKPCDIHVAARADCVQKPCPEYDEQDFNDENRGCICDVTADISEAIMMCVFEVIVQHNQQRNHR